MRPVSHRRRLGPDEAGFFPVVEAILVAALVLTAIIFFTSVQRPTSGSEQGGLDLGQVAADNLALLQAKYGSKILVGSATTSSAPSASYAGTSQYNLDLWVKQLLEGDQISGTTTAAGTASYLAASLPVGSRFSLRLANGVSNMTLLSSDPAGVPHQGRASALALLPDWTAFKAFSPNFTVVPGQVIPSTDAAYYPLVNSTTYRCFLAPTGDSRFRDGPDVDANPNDKADYWRGHWQSTPNATTPWKTVAGQVPTDLPLGIWKVWPGQDCATGTPVYVNVARAGDGARSVADGVTAVGTTVTSATAGFTASDVGRPIAGGSIPASAKILGWTSATQVTISAAATAAATAVPLTIWNPSPYVPYTLQLVVWFGA